MICILRFESRTAVGWNEFLAHDVQKTSRHFLNIISEILSHPEARTGSIQKLER